LPNIKILLSEFHLSFLSVDIKKWVRIRFLMEVTGVFTTKKIKF